jgi:hypothetical protein
MFNAIFSCSGVIDWTISVSSPISTVVKGPLIPLIGGIVCKLLIPLKLGNVVDTDDRPEEEGLLTAEESLLVKPEENKSIGCKDITLIGKPFNEYPPNLVNTTAPIDNDNISNTSMVITIFNPRIYDTLLNDYNIII